MMEKEKINDKIRQIKRKMMNIEWDMKHHHAMSKDHIYNSLKSELDELKSKL